MSFRFFSLTYKNFQLKKLSPGAFFWVWIKLSITAKFNFQFTFQSPFHNLHLNWMVLRKRTFFLSCDIFQLTLLLLDDEIANFAFKLRWMNKKRCLNSERVDETKKRRSHLAKAKLSSVWVIMGGKVNDKLLWPLHHQGLVSLFSISWWIFKQPAARCCTQTSSPSSNFLFCLTFN